jgi:hypothetical protein
VSTTDTVSRLRAAANWLELNDVSVHQALDDGTRLTFTNYGGRAAEMAETVRTLGGEWEKRADDSSELFYLAREVAPSVFYTLVAWRAEVCTRVVTATREVEVEEPDPEAVAALPKVKRTETVEDVEWRCEPLLARAKAPVPAGVNFDDIPF